MKKRFTPLLLILAVALSIVAYKTLKKDEAPITRCIGLHPDLDKTRDRFNRDTVRNIVYRNTASDPLFYSWIVHKIEACDWTKAKKLIKNGNVDGDRFALAESSFREDALREKIAFVSQDWRFQCVVYNGTDFVLVVLTSWH
jgi:hypothetical protein